MAIYFICLQQRSRQQNKVEVISKVKNTSDMFLEVNWECVSVSLITLELGMSSPGSVVVTYLLAGAQEEKGKDTGEVKSFDEHK